MVRRIFIVVFFCFFQGIDNLIVPDELPTILSLVYSNLPPIKKGTDSRLGWGFRLGDHADFQVLLELGPQTRTQPLGNEADKSNKRNVGNNLRDTLYAQTQYLKKIQKEKNKDQISATDGGSWIKSWKEMMQEPVNEDLTTIGAIGDVGVGEVDAKKVIPPELEDLYGSQQKKS